MIFNFFEQRQSKYTISSSRSPLPLPPLPSSLPCTTQCTKHGVKEKCSKDGCNTVAQNRGLCTKHGARGMCSIEGCANAGQSRGLCKKHGSKRLCSFDGCKTVSRNRGLCFKHGAFTRCSFEGCTSAAKVSNNYSFFLKKSFN